ncbi:contactin [Linepithema humile]|uniref:contactin n=1 Tax=Linepithema humile TaxID=83485 RepID=UPI00062386B7|nr:PREDICTED: contactin [Linepithema humile]
MSRIMTCLLSTVVFSLILLFPALAQHAFYQQTYYKCPQHWKQFQDSCYRFVKSPLRQREDARKNCQAFQSDLLSIHSLEEYRFVLYELIYQDPQHRRWLTGVRLINGIWINEADGTSMQNMDNAFLPEPNDNVLGREYLAYSYSNSLQRWGLEKVTNREELLYICKGSISILYYLVDDDRSFQYGHNIDNPLQIPRGPYFIVQPKKRVFDSSRRKTNNDISLSCLAGGYPTPTYEWYKEEYLNDRLVSIKIDPIKNSKYTISGGTLIIYDPAQNRDHGMYHCKAKNKFGTILSESVELLFGYILEFNLKRSEERGDIHWGKTIYCDPPQHQSDVKYLWSRDWVFPNFVEESKRVFVSYDGALYFSALESVDEGNYSCSLQNVASNTGRNGPFFSLWVDSSTSYQQLKFPNNFPKAFPESPIAGREVRMECIAFGYPVPSYNWTRRDAPLPRDAQITSGNRVLILRQVQVEDQGEYICRAFNDRLSIQNSVYLTIRAEPNFTIPLVDKHMDNKADLTWTCEAFGIPDVTYYWLRNSEILNDTLPHQDRDRYTIQDNVLNIKRLDPERDQAMYQCCARNSLKTRCSSAQLRILSLKPSFKKRPMESETYAAEGGNVTIVCKPEAAPRPKFIWKKDGNVIGSGGRRRILDTGNLIISPVSRDDEGTYVCTASNEYGSDESRGRLIVLRGAEFIERLPPRIVMSYNDNQTLRCLSHTDELLDVAYIWTHNGMSIRDEDLRYNPRWNINNEYLDIINATYAEAGEYECILKSAVGEISSRTNLIIEGPPGPPGGIQVFNIERNSVTLRWIDGAFNGREITKYTISGRTNYNRTWFPIAENITAYEVDRYTGRKEARMENVLNPYSTYEFRVQAFNIYGYGPPSTSSPQYRTSTDRPTKAPSNIGGGGGNIGDLMITWNPLSQSDQNAPGIHYRVFWRRQGLNEFQTQTLEKFGNTGRYSTTVGRDNYYMKYEVRVQAINDIGEGPISEIKVVYSAEDMPQVAPQLVYAMSYNSTSLNVTWAPIEQTRERVRGKLIGHRIKYWVKDHSREEDSTYYLSRSTRNWALIVGLQPDTYYYVKVMAFNSAGEGPESERYIERTYRKAPQKPPSSVNVYGVNPSTVRVTWRYVQPSMDEEPLKGYKIRIWEVDQDMSTAEDTIIPGGSKLEADISNLAPGKRYHMRVLAFSNGGDGRMSSPTHTFQMGDTAAFRSNAENKILDVTLLITSLLFLRVFGFI